MTPSDRRYARTHEWVKIEDGLAVVGISDYAQDSLGDITFVELPDTDTEMEAGSECAVVESVKAASDIYMPVSGTIVAVNEGLDDRPEMINEDCYGEGWIFKMEGVSEEDLEALMDASEYESMTDDGEED